MGQNDPTDMTPGGGFARLLLSQRTWTNPHYQREWVPKQGDRYAHGYRHSQGRKVQDKNRKNRFTRSVSSGQGIDETAVFPEDTDLVLAQRTWTNPHYQREWVPKQGDRYAHGRRHGQGRKFFDKNNRFARSSGQGFDESKIHPTDSTPH